MMVRPVASEWDFEWKEEEECGLRSIPQWICHGHLSLFSSLSGPFHAHSPMSKSSPSPFKIKPPKRFLDWQTDMTWLRLQKKNHKKKTSFGYMVKFYLFLVVQVNPLKKSKIYKRTSNIHFPCSLPHPKKRLFHMMLRGRGREGVLRHWCIACYAEKNRKQKKTSLQQSMQKAEKKYIIFAPLRIENNLKHLTLGPPIPSPSPPNLRERGPVQMKTGCLWVVKFRFIQRRPLDGQLDWEIMMVI